MSARRAPEKAGLAATSSSSTMSMPTASPTSPAPSAAATRPSTSRPNAVLGPSSAQRGCCADHATTAAATSSASGRPVKVVTASAPAAPSAPASAPSKASAWTCPPMVSLRRAAAPSSSVPTCGRSGSVRTAIIRPLPAGGRRHGLGPDGGIGGCSRQRAPLGQQRDGLGRLFRRGTAEDLRGAVVVHHPGAADRGGTPRLAPGALPQRGGRRHRDPVGGHLGPFGRWGLAGLTEALGHREQGGQRDLDLVHAVVVLEGQRQVVAGYAHDPDAGGEGHAQ